MPYLVPPTDAECDDCGHQCYHSDLVRWQDKLICTSCAEKRRFNIRWRIATGEPADEAEKEAK